MDENNNKQGGDNNGRKPQNVRIFIICLIAAILAMLFFKYLTEQVQSAKVEEVTYDEFLKMLEKGDIESVVIENNLLHFQGQLGSFFRIELPAELSF